MEVRSNNLERNALSALNRLDLDSLRFRMEGEVTPEMRAYCDGGEYRVRKGEEVGWRGHAGPDVSLWSSGEYVGFSGSPHKDALGVSVGPFGREEFVVWVERLAERIGMPLPVVLGGRVSRLDVAANLDVEAPVIEYVSQVEAPQRMRRRLIRSGTVVVGNSIVDLTLYDKVRQITAKAGAHHLPEYWKGKHVLRAEMRIKRPKKDLGVGVTVGDLCEEEFWATLAERYEGRFLSIPFLAGGAVGSPKNVRALVRVYAARGILSLGGVEAAYDRIETGEHSRSQRVRQRKAVVETVEKYGGDGHGLAEEFRRLIKTAAVNQ